MFGVTAGTIRTSLSQRYLPAAYEAAKVERFTPHGLRRLVANQYYRSGMDPTVAAHILGHSPQTMLRYYRQVSLTDARTAASNSGLSYISASIIPFPSKRAQAPTRQPDGLEGGGLLTHHALCSTP
jgi:hypothetical protein